MKIAIPVAGGKLCPHFGHCEQFAFYDVDPANRAILGRGTEQAPEHAPGLLPRWLAERGANLIIAGGMGGRAQALFAEAGLEVITGAPAAPPDSVVEDYLGGQLETGENVCDH